MHVPGFTSQALPDLYEDNRRQNQDERTKPESDLRPRGRRRRPSSPRARRRNTGTGDERFRTACETHVGQSKMKASGGWLRNPFRTTQETLERCNSSANASQEETWNDAIPPANANRQRFLTISRCCKIASIQSMATPWVSKTQMVEGIPPCFFSGLEFLLNCAGVMPGPL